MSTADTSIVRENAANLKEYYYVNGAATAAQPTGRTEAPVKKHLHNTLALFFKVIISCLLHSVYCKFTKNSTAPKCLNVLASSRRNGGARMS